MKLFFSTIIASLISLAFLASASASTAAPAPSATLPFSIPTLLAQTQPDPLQNEQAVQDRVATGSPSETLINDHNGGFIMAGYILLMIGLLIGAILYVSGGSKPNARNNARPGPGPNRHSAKPPAH